ncbi:type II secretion system protein [bacterium]|nr:type II secretion system protein [bacterium]
MKDFLKKGLAFTLAETLVVMGIIGVVAALTIPNLNQATGEKERVARVKKMYATLEDALGRTTAIYGQLEDWSTENKHANILSDRMVDFLKTVNSTTSNAAIQNTFFKDGKVYKYNTTSTQYKAFGTNSAAFLTADGSSVGIIEDGTNFTVFVDIDGPNKGTGTLGSDVFQFYLKSVNHYTLTPAGRYSTVGTDTGFGYTLSVDDCITNSNCTAWVIDHGNADYEKVNNTTKNSLNDSSPTYKK